MADVFQDQLWNQTAEELIKLSFSWRRSDLDVIDVEQALVNWSKVVEYIKEQEESLNDNLKLTCQAIGFFSSQLSTLNDPSNFYSDMVSNLRATTDSAEQSLVNLVQESGSYEFGGH